VKCHLNLHIDITLTASGAVRTRYVRIGSTGATMAECEASRLAAGSSDAATAAAAAARSECRLRLAGRKRYSLAS